MKKIILAITLLTSFSSFAGLTDVKIDFANEINQVADKIHSELRACIALEQLTIEEASEQTGISKNAILNWKNKNCMGNNNTSLNDLKMEFNL